MKLTDNLVKLFDKKPQRNDDDLPILPDGLVTPEERNALLRSFAVYRDKAPWLTPSQRGLSLASGIASELARLTVAEFSLTFENDGDRLLARSLDSFLSRLPVSVEYACATGGVMFKPCFDGRLLHAETVLPFDFIPLKTDGAGVMTECAFLSRIRKDGRFYTRVEEHRQIPDGYRITNRAYVSDRSFGRGRSCALTEIGAWAPLAPAVEIRGLIKPLFAYFGMPFGNLSSSDSPLGVPVFRRAEDLIRQADLQFGRLLWEFEGGELAVDASEDAFRPGRDGRPTLPIGKERLYRTNALDACSSSSELLKIFAPALRDQSFINGLNRIIMFIEDACGLARGTFSDPAGIARTATEIRSLRQRTFTTVTAVQASLRNALLALCEAMNDVALLYGLTDRPAEPILSFGDSVLTDAETERNADREDVRCGILTPDEYQKRWYGSTKGETI